jgi:hypothetical protein
MQALVELTPIPQFLTQLLSPADVAHPYSDINKARQMWDRYCPLYAYTATLCHQP